MSAFSRKVTRLRTAALVVAVLALSATAFTGVAAAQWTRSMPYADRVSMDGVHSVGVDTFRFTVYTADADGGHAHSYVMYGSKSKTFFAMVDQSAKQLKSSYATLVWRLKSRSPMPGDVYWYWMHDSHGVAFRYASRIIFGPWAE